MGRKVNKGPANWFWFVLGILNVVAVLYPVGLLVHADSSEASLFGAGMLMGILFLLLIADTIGIVMAYLP